MYIIINTAVLVWENWKRLQRKASYNRKHNCLHDLNNARIVGRSQPSLLGKLTCPATYNNVLSFMINSYNIYLVADPEFEKGVSNSATPIFN